MPLGFGTSFAGSMAQGIQRTQPFSSWTNQRMEEEQRKRQVMEQWAVAMGYSPEEVGTAPGVAGAFNAPMMQSRGPIDEATQRRQERANVSGMQQQQMQQQLRTGQTSGDKQALIFDLMKKIKAQGGNPQEVLRSVMQGGVSPREQALSIKQKEKGIELTEMQIKVRQAELDELQLRNVAGERLTPKKKMILQEDIQRMGKEEWDSFKKIESAKELERAGVKMTALHYLTANQIEVITTVIEEAATYEEVERGLTESGSFPLHKEVVVKFIRKLWKEKTKTPPPSGYSKTGPVLPEGFGEATSPRTGRQGSAGTSLANIFVPGAPFK